MNLNDIKQDVINQSINNINKNNGNRISLTKEQLDTIRTIFKTLKEKMKADA